MVLRVPDQQFIKQAEGYSLVTAEIIYEMPDYRGLIQQLFWQDFDIVPDLPKLYRFIDFWQRTLEGPVRKVIVSHHQLLTPTELKIAQGRYAIN